MKNWPKWPWENARHFLPKREKIIMKAPSCRWMINALHHWLNFYKNSMVKNILSCQNNHLTFFSPKSGLNGLRKMPTIYHLWGIKKLWENKFVGGWFIHLSFESYFKTSLLSSRYFPSKSPIHLVLHLDKKMPHYFLKA